MANYRADRMSEDIQREIAAILREMKDPRLHNGIISVVRCETAHDLSYSKVYISSMQGLETAKEAVKALKNAQGFIRRELGKRMIIRYTPELIFVNDRNIAYGVHIARILADTAGTEAETHDNDEPES